MVSVGDKVKEAIDWMDRGDLGQALSAASVAVDITAQRHAGADHSGYAIRKRFVRDYLWLIGHLGFPGGTSSTQRDPLAGLRVTPWVRERRTLASRTRRAQGFRAEPL